MLGAQIKIVDVSSVDALHRWSVARGLRGRDIADTLSKSMRYVVSFALAKIPKGDAAKIRSDLEQVVQQYKGARLAKGKSAAKWRGTLAAKIVFALNWKGARDLALSRAGGFYPLVGKFVNARSYSANLHRAGFLPALNVVGKQSDPGRLPKYRNMPGAIEHEFTEDVASILVENFASQAGPRAAGIEGLAGDALERAVAELEQMVIGFLEKDFLQGAQAAGLPVT